MNAALIAKLIQAGTPAELVAEVAVELGRAEAAQQIIDQRRAKDRARSAQRLEDLPDDWDELRIAIFERDDWTCKYCGDREPQQWHCDHVIPLSKGGTSDPSNLATSCRSCNSSKGDRLLSEWGGRK